MTINDTGEQLTVHELLLRMEAKAAANGNVVALKSQINRGEAAEQRCTACGGPASAWST